MSQDIQDIHTDTEVNDWTIIHCLMPNAKQRPYLKPRRLSRSRKLMTPNTTRLP